MKNSIDASLKIKMELPYDLVIHFCEYNQRKQHHYLKKILYLHTYYSIIYNSLAMETILLDEWIKTVWYIYNEIIRHKQ